MNDEGRTSTPAPTARRWFWALAGVAVSMPLALGLEVLVRKTLLPASVEELRLLLSPFLTPVTWALAVVAVPVDLAALLIHRRLWVRAGTLVVTPGEVGWKRFESLMISASIAQLPAVAVIFLSLLGAELAPVVATMIISTAGVVAIGLYIR